VSWEFEIIFSNSNSKLKLEWSWPRNAVSVQGQTAFLGQLDGRLYIVVLMESRAIYDEFTEMVSLISPPFFGNRIHCCFEI